MRVDVTFTFHCSVEGCDVTEVDHRADVPSHRLPDPRIPGGWTPIGLLLFCPRHTLMLSVDGHAQVLVPEDTEGEEGAA